MHGATSYENGSCLQWFQKRLRSIHPPKDDRKYLRITATSLLSFLGSIFTRCWWFSGCRVVYFVRKCNTRFLWPINHHFYGLWLFCVFYKWIMLCRIWLCIYKVKVTLINHVLHTCTRPSSRRLQQACCQPVVECRRQAACQMRSRGMLRPVVTCLLQTVVRSAANCCDRTAAALLETNLLHPVVTELRQCCCGQNCSRL